MANDAGTDGHYLTTDPYEAFNRDVPEAMRYDVMTMLAEAAQGDDHADVHILDRDRIDAINARAHGIVTIDGEEYSFQLEDGNWNGTVLLDWEGGREFVHHVPTRWALQPDYALVNDAIANQRGPFLLFKWDAMLNNHPAIAAIPGKYSYDRMMQPGGFIEKHYRDAAAKHRFVIVDQEQADETRAQLAKACPA